VLQYLHSPFLRGQPELPELRELLALLALLALLGQLALLDLLALLAILGQPDPQELLQLYQQEPPLLGRQELPHR
jgi:hypothetical protein